MTVAVANERRSAAPTTPQEQGGPQIETVKELAPQKRRAFPSRDISAFAVSVAFLLLGFVAIYAVHEAVAVKDGVVLATVLVVPALLYLLLSGRVSELKGPGGLEFRLSAVASQAIPGPSEDGATRALSYEEVRAVDQGRDESFCRRIQDIETQHHVVLTLKLGSDAINGDTVANYAKGLAQFPRFRFVAIVDSERRLISYMDQSAFRHVLEAKLVDSQQLLTSIEQRDVGWLRSYPGMIISAVTPKHSIASALRAMDDLRANALLVTEDGHIKGVVERDRLANALLLSLVEHASG
jgi:CBS domain-containing protein